jgi:hypothetical protein
MVTTTRIYNSITITMSKKVDRLKKREEKKEARKSAIKWKDLWNFMTGKWLK